MTLNVKFSDTSQNLSTALNDSSQNLSPSFGEVQRYTDRSEIEEIVEEILTTNDFVFDGGTSGIEDDS